MKRFRRLLLIVVVLETLAGSAYVYRLQQSRTLPVPTFDGFPSVIQDRIETEINACRADVAADWNHLGETLFALGFNDHAEVCHIRAVELQPATSKWKFNLAFCRAARGQTKLAAQGFHEVIQMKAANAADCWYFLGTIGLRENRTDEAREAFQKAAALPAAKLQLAKLAVKDQDWQAAQDLLVVLQESHAQTRDIQHLWSVVKSASGDENSARVHAMLADLLSEVVKGPWNERAEYLEGLCQTGRVSSRVQAGMELIAEGKIAEARELAEAANERLWDPQLEDFLSDVAFAENKWEEQVQRLKKVIERDGADSYRMSRLATAQIATGNTKAAVQSLKTGIDLHSETEGRTTVDMCLQYAQILGDAGDVAGSQSLAAKAAFMEGLGLLQAGKVGEAADWIQRSAQFDASSDRTLFWFGNALQMIGQRDAAIAAYEECLNLSPHHERAKQRRDMLKSAAN